MYIITYNFATNQFYLSEDLSHLHVTICNYCSIVTLYRNFGNISGGIVNWGSWLSLLGIKRCKTFLLINEIWIRSYLPFFP